MWKKGAVPFFLSIRYVSPNIEAKDVEATILLQDPPEKASFEDGLLGMSFLGRYKTHVDYSGKKFIIEA